MEAAHLEANNVTTARNDIYVRPQTLHSRCAAPTKTIRLYATNTREHRRHIENLGDPNSSADKICRLIPFALGFGLALALIRTLGIPLEGFFLCA